MAQYHASTPNTAVFTRCRGVPAFVRRDKSMTDRAMSAGLSNVWPLRYGAYFAREASGLLGSLDTGGVASLGLASGAALGSASGVRAVAPRLPPITV